MNKYKTIFLALISMFCSYSLVAEKKEKLELTAKEDRIVLNAYYYSQYQIKKYYTNLKENTEADLSKVSKEYRTVFFVRNFHEIFRNGGLTMFFESYFEIYGDYSLIINAYKEIKCFKSAKCIEDAVNSFPFKQPHKNAKKRKLYIEKNYNKKDVGVKGWNDYIAGDPTVYRNLLNYIKQNKDKFKLLNYIEEDKQ